MMASNINGFKVTAHRGRQFDTICPGRQDCLGGQSYIGHSPRVKISPRTGRRSQESRHRMSAKRPKAEVAIHEADVRYVPLAEVRDGDRGGRLLHDRYVTFQLAEVAVPRNLFREILGRIDEL